VHSSMPPLRPAQLEALAAIGIGADRRVTCWFDLKGGDGQWESGCVSRVDPAGSGAQRGFFVAYDGEEWPEPVLFSCQPVGQTWRAGWVDPSAADVEEEPGEEEAEASESSSQPAATSAVVAEHDRGLQGRVRRRLDFGPDVAARQDEPGRRTRCQPPVSYVEPDTESSEEEEEEEEEEQDEDGNADTESWSTGHEWVGRRCVRVFDGARIGGTIAGWAPCERSRTRVISPALWRLSAFPSSPSRSGWLLGSTAALSLVWLPDTGLLVPCCAYVGHEDGDVEDLDEAEAAAALELAQEELEEPKPAPVPPASPAASPAALVATSSSLTPPGGGSDGGGGDSGGGGGAASAAAKTLSNALQRQLEFFDVCQTEAAANGEFRWHLCGWRLRVLLLLLIYGRRSESVNCVTPWVVRKGDPNSSFAPYRKPGTATWTEAMRLFRLRHGKKPVVFGHVEGVPEGTMVVGRQRLILLGLHRPIMAGISYVSKPSGGGIRRPWAVESVIESGGPSCLPLCMNSKPPPCSPRLARGF
jgi:hypothetical protein